MLKKTIQYTDYNGLGRSEAFYFNLSKAEIAEMELSVNGGMSEMLRRITEENNYPELVKVVKMLVLKSYGEKSSDGKRFIKSEEGAVAFSQTEAYSKLFMELVSDAEFAASFLNGIMPAAESARPVLAVVEKD